MNARHATALTLLATWCLMLPLPFGVVGKPLDVHAPMSQWRCIAEFDSAFECQRAKKSKGDVLYVPGAYLWPVQFSSARCVSKDDPRLKSK